LTRTDLALGLLRLAGITQITRTVPHIAADWTWILPISAAATSKKLTLKPAWIDTPHR
jgi:hypothetical protein